jgi:hypothetical protein
MSSKENKRDVRVSRIDLLVLFKDRESPSESDRGKPLIGTPGSLRWLDRSSTRYRSIETTETSEVRGYGDRVQAEQTAVSHLANNLRC